MKITIYCNNGANCQSTRSTEITTEELGFTDAEWNALTEEEKQKQVFDTVVNDMGWIEIWHEEA